MTHLHDEEKSILGIGSKKENFEDELVNLGGCMQNTRRVWTILVAKLKRQRLIALTAMSRSKLILAKMRLLIAENVLNKINDNHDVKSNGNKNTICGSTSGRSDQRYTPYRRSSTPSASSSQSSDLPNSTRSRSSHVFSRDHTPSQSQRDSSPKAITLSSESNLNSTNNSTTSTMTQSPLSLSTLSTSEKSSSNDHTSASNKSLSDSIIAEFNKSHQRVGKLVNSNTSHSFSSSTTNENISVSNNAPRKYQHIKIRPVSNISAYQTAYTLKQRTKILYTPEMPNMRPLHPKDPRAHYSKLILESKGKTRAQSPMKLAVPPMLRNSGTSAPLKYNTAQNMPCPKYTPAMQLQNAHVAIPVTEKLSECRTIVSPSASNNFQHAHLAISSPLKGPEYRHVIIPEGANNKLGAKYSENICDTSVPTVLSMLKCHDYNLNDKPVVTTKSCPANQHVLMPTTSNNIEHKPMALSTPQKWFENKHICIPTTPVYRRCDTRASLLSSNTKDAKPLFYDYKENCPPDAPKQVKFYHSS